MDKSKGKGSISTKTKKQRPALPEAISASFTGETISTASCSSSPSTGSRRNLAGSITRTNRFINIQEGVTPFFYGTGKGKYGSTVSSRDQIILCQKAYWNVPIFRNTIDLMTEFSCSPIYFTGGNKESRDFFNIWAKKINLWKLTDMFFREYYRSGNVFLYRLYGDYDKSEIKNLEKLNLSRAAARVPLYYMMLNPADIETIPAATFLFPRYTKSLNRFEIQALLSENASAADKQILNSIPELKDFKNKSVESIVIELDPDRLASVFYKKQDYEPLSVPMGFPVLESINWKMELTKIDMAISRTVSQVVLLVTQGSDEREPSPQNLAAIKNIFENQSVGRVLVADYTTDAKFVIPEIGNILDPKKYEIVERDIRLGLNNVLFGDEKFASTSVKMDVWFERLRHSREEFMQFLTNEVNNIGKLMNFKSVPIPRWSSESLGSDPTVLSRVYTRMLELGALTPQETIDAIKNNKLPTQDEMNVSQPEFLEQKEKGWFTPLLNQGKDDGTEGAGRPTGSSSPKTVSRPSPAGTKSVAFSVAKISDTIRQKDDLFNLVSTKLKKKYKVKKMTKEQIDIANTITNMIVSTEVLESWSSKADDYIINPIQQETEITKEVFDIAQEHGLSVDEAAILYHSKAEEK